MTSRTYVVWSFVDTSLQLVLSSRVSVQMKRSNHNADIVFLSLQEEELDSEEEEIRRKAEE